MPDFRSVRIRNPVLVVSARRHEKAGFFKTRRLWIAIKMALQNRRAAPRPGKMVRECALTIISVKKVES
jgi:hypothetical protein